MEGNKKEILKNLPKIDEVLLVLEKQGIYNRASREIVKDACRHTVQRHREEMLASADNNSTNPTVGATEVAADVERFIDNLYSYKLKRVVNASGVILHTNLGRAPLCPEALERILEVGRGYSNLEFDLSRGERGLRYDHVGKLICALTKAEDALIVNNNAAAVLLVLNTLAQGKEVIVSRGELIEIGGEFRLPDVMSKSFSILREIGTTNRTRLADYEKAIGPSTGLILKVHTSNYRIIGFTEEAQLVSLVHLGKKYSLPVVNDLGSGSLINLDMYGFAHEPTVREALLTGVDLVTFSGDKLLGGPQAGIIAGKKEMVLKVKNNPLNRALRIDKFTLAALEATLMQYIRPDNALSNLRSLQAMTESLSSVKKRARKLFNQLTKLNLPDFSFFLRQGVATVGGGSLPTQEIPTILVGMQSRRMSAERLEDKLRQADVPLIVRVDKDEILFDLRSVAVEEFVFIQNGLKQALEK